MKTILEIGGGRTPYFVRYDITLIDPVRYICIDIEEKNIEFAKKELQAHKELGKSIPNEFYFNIEDAVTFPLPEKFADKIVFSNTLSAPIHYNWDEKGTKIKIKEGERKIFSENYNGDPFYAERKPIVEKAISSLKVGGSLFVYTDLIVYGLHSYNKILNELHSDPRLAASRNIIEEKRINTLNHEKIAQDKFCCCFRAEVLPECQVYEFVKI